MFIGNGLGSLIIQQALVLADIGQQYTDIKISTEAMVFLGAALGGPNIVTWATNACANDKPSLKTLKAGKTVLEALSEDFWASYDSIFVVEFYERYKSSCRGGAPAEMVREIMIQ